MMGGMMSGISSGLAGGSARRAPPIPPPAPLASSPISPHDECDCGGDPTKYSTLGSAVNCFGANDVTNLEVMFSGLAVTDETRAFYTLCSDYDNDGVFRANDLTNMKQAMPIRTCAPPPSPASRGSHMIFCTSQALLRRPPAHGVPRGLMMAIDQDAKCCSSLSFEAGGVCFFGQRGVCHRQLNRKAETWFAAVCVQWRSDISTRGGASPDTG
eukprot:1230264-Prymnesium_polylepis.1